MANKHEEIEPHRSHAEFSDGSIRRLKKDCGCVTHDGPHWLHMDEIVRRIKATDVEAQIARLGQKLYEMEASGIVRLLTDHQAKVLLTAKGQPQLSLLLQIRDHIEKEADFNRTWIYLHLRDGQQESSDYRRKIVIERLEWIDALDEAILAVAQAEGGTA